MTPTAEPILTLKRPAAPIRARAERLTVIYRLEPFIAGLALIALAPVLLTAGLVILLLSRRTPLVRHTRVGWRGETLPMLKLRTMWEPHQEWGPILTVEDVSSHVPVNKTVDDDRVTSRFAAFCRRYSVDEIPQLYHVLRGQMSFIGPRPITQAEIEEYYADCAEAVLSLRPGLSGLWQMKGRNRLNYSQRRRLDVWLACHASPGLYLRILLRTVPVVFRGNDAY